MSNVKIKQKATINKLDKKIVQVQKFKNNLITTKDKLNEYSTNENKNTAEDYASNKVQNNISYISKKGIVKANEIGKKSLKETQENFIKGKQKIEILKSRIREGKAKTLKNTAEKTNKTIKTGAKQSIKLANNAKSLTKKGIKTTEQVTKNTKKVAKESIKLSQRIARITKRTIHTTIKTTKTAIKVTIATIKTIIAGTKALIVAIASGGWIVVAIILIIVLIGGFIALIFNNTEDPNYDISQITNSEIILVATAEIGNVGGEKFWRWYRI